jgi:hypothetical protein
MSIREEIAKNIVTTLKEIPDIKPVLVTREPFDVEKIAVTQFPAVLIETAEENRNTATMSAGIRSSTIIYNVRGYVRGTELDTKRNDLIEAIEEALDADRVRGLSGQVQDTQITRIEVITRMPPLAEVLITVEVRYIFQRGAA